MKHKLYKLLAATLIIATILCCFSACGDVAVEELVLSEKTITLNVGNASSISCQVLPENATDKTVRWSSSDNAVATVNDVGVITAVGPGTCTIKAMAGEVTAQATIIVKKPVEQISLNKTNITIKEEETFALVCTIVPNDASEQLVSWTSSDATIATVDANGTVTGVKTGTCTITASVDGKTAVASVTVNTKGPDFKVIYDELCVSTWADLGSDNSYLHVDTNPYNEDGGDWNYMFTVTEVIKDINKRLGMPESVYNDMMQTTWSMGKQKETFSELGFEVTWTYHPDKGLEVTYKLINN